MDNLYLWERYKKHLCYHSGIGLMVDISRIAFTDDFLSSMAPLMRKAYHAMADLERGGIANPDEERMVTCAGDPLLWRPRRCVGHT